MGYKILGGTQANWIISIVDGYFKRSDSLNRFIKDENKNKFVILWAWQTKSGLDKIQNLSGDDDIFFMTEKNKAEIIGCGKWLERLPQEDLSEYWKNQPQFHAKWEHPYLLEVNYLEKHFLNTIKTLSSEEIDDILKTKNIDRRRFFSSANIVKIPSPEGGSIWETVNPEQASRIEQAKTTFVPTFSTRKLEIPSFWWVCQGNSYTEDVGYKYLWAPLTSKDGKTISYYENVKKTKKGDIIFNFADGQIRGLSIAENDGYNFVNEDSGKWNKEGTRVDIEHFKIDPISVNGLKLKKEDFDKVLGGLKGPFDINGNIKEGYLFDFNIEAAQIIRDIYEKPFPEKIERYFKGKTKQPSVSTHVTNLLEKKKQIILYGPPGTGKTFNTKHIVIDILN